MSKYAAVAALTVVSLCSSQVQAEVRTKLRRGTLTISVSGLGQSVSVLDEPDNEGGSINVYEGYGSDPTESVPSDEVTNIVINSRGHQSIFVGMANGQSVSVRTGSCRDSVRINGTIGDLSVSTGGGDDHVSVFATVLGTTNIKTGGGRDFCSLAMSDFLGDINIALGADDDYIDTYLALFGFSEQESSNDDEPSDPGIRIRINGNGGCDSFTSYGNNIDLPEYLRSFEHEGFGGPVPPPPGPLP